MSADAAGEATELERFWRAERPEVLERYTAQAAASLADGAGAGELAHALLWLHHHAIVGDTEGIVRESRRAHRLGATKDQLLELSALAFIQAGPMGMRALALGTSDLIAGYVPVTPQGRPFPVGWEPDANAFRSGIEFRDPALSSAELELLRQWYRRTLGELPPYVEFLGRYRPGLLKVFRNRFETAVRGALPAQVVPFVLLHMAAVRGQEHGAREAALLARGLGVTRAQALEAVAAAFLVSGPAALGVVESAAGDVFRAW